MRFAAEFDQQVDRRHPSRLHTVVAVLRAEHCFIDERLIDKIPRVRVFRIEIADIGKESSGFDGEARGQRRRLHESFFHIHIGFIAVACERYG